MRDRGHPVEKLVPYGYGWAIGDDWDGDKERVVFWRIYSGAGSRIQWRLRGTVEDGREWKKMSLMPKCWVMV